MPAKTASKVDAKTFQKVANWSLAYYLDPQRGNRRRLPTAQELTKQFPGVEIPHESLASHIQTRLGVKKLEGATEESHKTEEISEEQEGGKDKKENKKQEKTPAHYGYVSATGVLAELKTVEPILKKHQQEAQKALQKDLLPTVKELIPQLGIKNLSEQQLNQIATEIATETARQSLDDVANVNNPQQIEIIVADSLTQTIVTHPEIETRLKLKEEQVLEKVAPRLSEVVQKNQPNLEKAAVLSNLVSIARMEKPTQEISDDINNQIKDHIEPQAPLNPELAAPIKARTDEYLKTYVSMFKQEIAPFTPEKLPTFDQLSGLKEKIHKDAVNKVYAETGDELKTIVSHNIKLKDAISHVAGNLGLTSQPLTLSVPTPATKKTAAPPAAPKTTPRAQPPVTTNQLPVTPKLPFGSGLILSSPKRVHEAYLSLLSTDQEKLKKAIEENKTQIEKYKNKKTLTHKEKKEYTQAQKLYTRYTSAQTFHAQNTRKAQTYRTMFARAYGGRVELASQNIWMAENRLLANWPKIFAYNDRLAAGAAFGSLGFRIGGLDLGRFMNRMSTQMSSMSTAKRGMGLFTKPLTSAFVSPLNSVANRIARYALLPALGAYFLFMGLGQAAATGFLVGATIGGTVGAGFGVFIGLQVAALCGPFAPICAMGSVPAFAFAGGLLGGTIGGIAAGLIAAGIASGSATMVSMGLGTGVGGSIGAVIGFNVGAGLTAVAWTALIGLCIGSLVCAPFAPLMIAAGPAVVYVGGFVGATVGAVAGSLIGASIGYLYGHYVAGTIGVPASGALAGAAIGFYFGGPVGALIGGTIGWFATGGWSQIKNFFAGAEATTASAASGIVGSAIGFFSGLWGGISSVAGGALGFISGGLNLLVGGGLGASLPVAAVLIPVGGAVGVVGVTALVASAITVSSFSTLATDEAPTNIVAGENQYFTINKTSSTQKLDNAPPNKEITFTITLTAKKTNLADVSVIEEMTVQPKSGSPFSVTNDKDGKPISPVPCQSNINANGTCTYTFPITVDSSFDDSVIINTVTAQATPQGQSQVKDSSTTTVVVGNPPAECPRGWPAIGQITQGPEGAASHADNVFGGYEAIDIGQGTVGGMGKPVFATVEGTVDLVWQGSGGPTDRRIRIKVADCAGLQTVNFWHLSQVSVSEGQFIKYGDEIGKTGSAGSGPHIHYMFNELGQRHFKIEPPYIPQAVKKRNCNNPEDCGVTINSAP